MGSAHGQAQSVKSPLDQQDQRDIEAGEPKQRLLRGQRELSYAIGDLT